MNRADLATRMAGLLGEAKALASLVDVRSLADAYVNHLWHLVQAVVDGDGSWRIKNALVVLLHLGKIAGDDYDVTVRACFALREAGQREYAHDDQNAFGNFERVAGMLGLHRERVLLVYLLKHLDGIKAWANGHVSQREPVNGRIRDALVYLCILEAMRAETDAATPCAGGPS